MSARRSVLSPIALFVAVVIGACNATPPPNTPEPNANVATPSASTAAVLASPTTSPSPTATATPAPSPTAAPTPTPQPKPAAWRTFTSNRWRFSIKYPPGWIVTRAASNRLPDQFDDFGLFETHVVYASRDIVAGTASINLTATHDIAYFKSHYKARLVSNTRVRVAGWPGRLMIFRGSQSGRALYIQHLILAKGRVGYIIDMYSDRGHDAADKVLFRKMYTTLKPRF